MDPALQLSSLGQYLNPGCCFGPVNMLSNMANIVVTRTAMRFPYETQSTLLQGTASKQVWDGMYFIIRVNYTLLSWACSY